MALNIAVPLSGVGGLSPISPIAIDCWEQIKMLVSPIGSESSGVSSLDSEEAKLQSLLSTPPDTPEEFEIRYHGRDILDLGANINPDKWTMRYTYLPENNNMPMYLANRSQYHRLGLNGHMQDYSLVRCEHCDFQYPINSGSSYFCRTSVTVSPTTTSTMTYSRPQMFNRQQQQQPKPSQQKQQSLPPTMQNIYHSNNSNYNMYNNSSNQINSNSFLKKTTATTINTIAAPCTFSSAPSSALSFTSSTSPTSSLSSGYSSSSSINNGGGNYSNFSANGIRFPQQSSPSSNNSNTMFMNNNNANANNNNNNNIKSSGMPSNTSNTFNNFGSFLNAFSNNLTNNGYVNQAPASSASQQPPYTGMYNYFS